jgi:hypothetical protein
VTPSLKEVSIEVLRSTAVEKSRKEGISWTQTPEGREIRSREMKARLKKKEAPHSHSNGTKAPPAQFENQIAYVYGRIEAQLEVYSSQLGVPFPILARGISELLRGKESRSVLGPTHRVPRVR